MTRPGPPRTPTPILKMHGSWRAKNRPDANLPDGVVAVPDCPAWLSDGAAEVWRKLVPQFASLGILTLVDENALARYCSLWVQWRELLDFIEEHGMTYDSETTGGAAKVVQHPNVALSLTISAQLLRLEQDFGMTPSSRASLEVLPRVPKESKLESLQRQAGAG